jgi:hypothetical protein
MKPMQHCAVWAFRYGFRLTQLRFGKIGDSVYDGGMLKLRA